MRTLTIIVATIAMAGCNQPGTPGSGYQRGAQVPVVETLLSTDAPEYAIGKPITVRFTNRLGRALGYNLCRARLERSESDVWQPIMASLAQMCTAEIRTLRPGQGVTYTFLPEGSSIRRGDYRIAADLEDLQARTRLLAVSNTFRIARESSD
jgi:hypothetical protein